MLGLFVMLGAAAKSVIRVKLRMTKFAVKHIQDT